MSQQEIERVVERYSDSLLRLAMHHVKEQAQAQRGAQQMFPQVLHGISPFFPASRIQSLAFFLPADCFMRGRIYAHCIGRMTLRNCSMFVKFNTERMCMPDQGW